MTVKEARIYAGLSQSGLSDLFGIPIDVIKSWESGRRNPTDWAEKLIVEKLQNIRSEKTMNTEYILKMVDFNFKKEWEFIIGSLEKEEIQEIAEDFSGIDPFSPDPFGMINAPSNDYVTSCKCSLMRVASAKMWRRISKDQANSLLKAMQEIGVVDIKMPNMETYTAKEIIDSWKKANKSE